MSTPPTAAIVFSPMAMWQRRWCEKRRVPPGVIWGVRHIRRWYAPRRAIAQASLLVNRNGQKNHQSSPIQHYFSLQWEGAATDKGYRTLTTVFVKVKVKVKESIMPTSLAFRRWIIFLEGTTNLAQSLGQKTKHRIYSI